MDTIEAGKKPRKNYGYIGMVLDPAIKRRLRMLAASEGTSMAHMGGQLIEEGLKAREKSA